MGNNASKGDPVMQRQPITQEGYSKLRDEIRHLVQDVMPEIAEKIAEARAEGDLRENAEYHGQREEQGRMQAKINQLQSKLANCDIVDKSTMPKGIVSFGSIVTVKNLDDGVEEQYELVGPSEEDYNTEPMKILTSSPVAQALIGKKAGDQTDVEIPRGILRMEILAIKDV
jgi:transcription elongation factor GreA